MTGGAPRPGSAARRGPSMGPPLERVTIEQQDGQVAFRFTPKEGVTVPTTWAKTSTARCGRVRPKPI